MCSSNPLRRRLLQEPNLKLERVVKKVQAMEFAEKQSIIMQPEKNAGWYGKPKSNTR